MPISDYASAFFFARRKRVTPSSASMRGAVAIAISKLCPSDKQHQYQSRHRRLVKPAARHMAESEQVKVRGAQKLGTRKLRNHSAEKAKKPSAAGLFEANLFRSVHFASFAI